MALPWFPFHLDAYTRNTMHLTTEEHGAYLLLMLAYYQTEKPLLASDRTLASICKMPMDRWLEAKPTLAALFRPEDGYWHHDRISHEISDREAKHSATVARTQAARDAALAKRALKDQPQGLSQKPPQTKPKPKPPSQSSNKSAAKSVTEPVTETQPQPQPQKDMVGGGRAGARDETKQTPSPNLADIEDSLDGAHEADMGVPVDLWKPDPAEFKQADGEARLALLNKFFAHHAEQGTFSRDWPTLWRKFHDDATRPKRAPPRIETNKRPEPMPGQRVKISPEAMALATKIEVACGLEHAPQTVGFPAMIETWLASWPAEVIERVVIEVMEKRWADGAGPPASMKYFATPIARAIAEAKQPVPTNVKPNTGSAHDRRHANSTSAVAKRLAAEFEARDAGKLLDGGEVLCIADGTVQEE